MTHHDARKPDPAEASAHRDSDAPGDTTSPSPRTSTQSDGAKRLDPTRYGDWEKDGRCIDF